MAVPDGLVGRCDGCRTRGRNDDADALRNTLVDRFEQYVRYWMPWNRTGEPNVFATAWQYWLSDELDDVDINHARCVRAACATWFDRIRVEYGAHNASIRWSEARGALTSQPSWGGASSLWSLPWPVSRTRPWSDRSMDPGRTATTDRIRAATTVGTPTTTCDGTRRGVRVHGVCDGLETDHAGVGHDSPCSVRDVGGDVDVASAGNRRTDGMEGRLRTSVVAARGVRVAPGTVDGGGGSALASAPSVVGKGRVNVGTAVSTPLRPYGRRKVLHHGSRPWSTKRGLRDREPCGHELHNIVVIVIVYIVVIILVPSTGSSGTK